MEGYAIGLAVGIGAGIAIGIAIGRKQKPWSELTAAEKRQRIIAIAVGAGLLVIGVVVLLVRW
jgi:cytochrome c biogenesis protein CcdA